MRFVLENFNSFTVNLIDSQFRICYAKTDKKYVGGRNE